MIKEYKHALLFLAKYIVLYVALNSLYAWFVESYKPDPDPITVMVTKHAAALMTIFDEEVSYRVAPATPNIPLLKNNQTVVEVFEGCNSINVILVFVSFIIAFQGNTKLFLLFFIGGTTLIYLVNLLRVIALYLVALHFPQALYFFHKFLFTGAIYALVFALWYYWTIKVKEWKLQQV
jgi:exosortase family protein XrtF